MSLCKLQPQFSCYWLTEVKRSVACFKVGCVNVQHSVSLLHTLVEIGGYRSCSWFPVGSKQSCLLSDLSHQHFHPENHCSLDIFHFSGPFSVNLRDVCVGKPQQINTQTSPSGTSIHAAKSLMSMWLQTMSCCHRCLRK